MPTLDIFSKKKEKMEELEIVVDHRERNSLVISELMSLGVKVDFKQLPVADYLVNEIAIERKTISDFKSSIINKRIIYQLLELKQYKKSLLLLEGIEDEDIYSGGMHENAFRGFLLSVALEYNIPIIFTRNTKDTARYLYLLAKKVKKNSFSLRAKKITFSKEEKIQYILEGFPNIGPKKAKKLIEKFHSIKNIFDASEEDLKDILGKRTKDFLDLIN